MFDTRRYEPVPVEWHTDDGVEWYVGFGGPNVEPEKMVTVASKEDAFRLQAIVHEIFAAIAEE